MHICQWQPPAGATMAGVCETCAHAVTAHVGTRQCAICYMLAVTKAMQDTVRALGDNLRRMADAVRDQSWPNT